MSAREPTRAARRAGGRLATLALIIPTLLMACGKPSLPDLPPAPDVAEPEPSEVETVLFLWGDPGQVQALDHPIIPRLQEEVERWSRLLGRDSSVAVVNLGDVVYPDGMHPPDDSPYVVDSIRVQAQVDIVAGPEASAGRAFHAFVAGNHDWGWEEDREGARRLGNLERFLDRARERHGAAVELLPPAGDGGPAVVDVGRHVRLIFLDTAWWLMAADSEEELEVLRKIDRAMKVVDGRRVIMAAHHPFESAGPHGGLVNFWETFGIRYLLARSGAILQDLNSPPYDRFLDSLRDTFLEERRPHVFVGGHEHSLQVIRGMGLTDPQLILVSGTASKLTEVGHTDGMLFRRSEPGYMRLMVLKDGTMRLFVEAAPAEYLTCPDEEPERTTCMEEGVEAFRTVYQRGVP